MTVYSAAHEREPRVLPLLAAAAKRVRSLAARARLGVDRARSTALQVGGFAAFTVAGWQVSTGLGLLVLGVSLFAVEFLTRGEG